MSTQYDNNRSETDDSIDDLIKPVCERDLKACQERLQYLEARQHNGLAERLIGSLAHPPSSHGRAHDRTLPGLRGRLMRLDRTWVRAWAALCRSETGGS
jgi:hypothetical protein